MPKTVEVVSSARSWSVGICHHGFRAYAITGGATEAEQRFLAGRWHSGPALDRSPDFADMGGLKLHRCTGRDPYVAPSR